MSFGEGQAFANFIPVHHLSSMAQGERAFIAYAKRSVETLYKSYKFL
jgi:hypothetical protein